MKEVYYSLDSSAFNPIVAYLESHPMVQIEKVHLEHLHEHDGISYTHQLSIDVPMGDQELARQIFDNLERVAEGAGFRYPSDSLVAYHSKEGMNNDEKDRRFARQKVAA